MNKQTTIQILSWSSAILVLLLAVAGFALSYNALYNVALTNGLPHWAAIIWPLLIDAALVIFSIAVVRAYVWRESGLWPWLLIGIFTLLTIVFNLVHANENVTEVFSVPLRYLVAVVPPIALVLSFETLMNMLKSGVIRQGLLETIDELQSRLTELRQTVKAETDKYQARVDKARREYQELQDSLANEREKYQTELSELQTAIETKRNELADADKQPIIVVGGNDPTEMAPADRQPIVAELVKQGIADDQIMDIFGYSYKTLQRDKQALNGQLSDN